MRVYELTILWFSDILSVLTVLVHLGKKGIRISYDIFRCFGQPSDL